MRLALAFVGLLLPLLLTVPEVHGSEPEQTALHHVFFGTAQGVVRPQDVRSVHQAYMQALVQDGDCAQVSVPGQPFKALCGSKEEVLKSAGFDGGYLMSNHGGPSVCRQALSWWNASVRQRVQDGLPTLAVVYAGFKEADPSCVELAKALETSLTGKPSMIIWPELVGAVVPKAIRDLSKRVSHSVKVPKLKDLNQAGSAQWEIGDFAVDTMHPQTDTAGARPGKRANSVWLRAPVNRQGWRPIQLGFQAKARSGDLGPHTSVTFFVSGSRLRGATRWALPETMSGDIKAQMLVGLRPSALGVRRPQKLVVDVTPSVTYPGSAAQRPFSVTLQTGYLPIFVRSEVRGTVPFDARKGFGQKEAVTAYCTLGPDPEKNVLSGEKLVGHLSWNAAPPVVRSGAPEQKAVIEQHLSAYLAPYEKFPAFRSAQLHWKRPEASMCGEPPVSVQAGVLESNGWINPAALQACAPRVSIRGEDCGGWGALPWVIVLGIAAMVGMAFVSKRSAA